MTTSKLIDSKISVVFFGTHQFACVILEALLNNPNISVDLVITQPDRPTGRNQEMQKSPVKLLAEKHGLTIEQPPTLKNFQFSILNWKLGVVAQYGILIPEHILDTPEHGILNVHTSLLPKYRGASPIQTALMNGEIETGVTIMKMDVGMDTGPILKQSKISIEPNDTYLDLDKKLATLGAEFLLSVIPDYLGGVLQPIPQDNTLAISTKLIQKEDGKIKWDKTSGEIYNLFRGLTPWPGVWTVWDSKRLKLISIKPANRSSAPGKITAEDKQIFIGCSTGSIEVTELQLEGKKVMTPTEFLNGYKSFSGVTLG